MASSYWAKKFPEVCLRTTQNLYYDRYACRMEFYIHDGHRLARLLRYSRVVMRDLRSVTMPVRFYQTLAEIKKSKYPQVKVRAEMSRTQVYADTHQALREVMDQLLEQVGQHNVREWLVSIHLPDDSVTLKPGIKRVRRPSRYRYSVRLRGTQEVRRNRAEIERYIRNLGPEHADVGAWTWSGARTIYCNDVSHLDFLQLISPGCLGKIYELVPAQT